MRKHVVVATRGLPPCNIGPPLPGMPSALEPLRGWQPCAPRGMRTTHTPSPWPWRRPRWWRPQAATDRTAVWMAETGQSGNAAKSTSWLQREPLGGVAPLTLGGVAIPLSREFKQLGVGQCLAAEKGTGPVLRGRLDKGLAITRRVGCLPTFLMREAALGALANPVALYGVEMAEVEGRTLSAVDTAAAKAVRGPTRCSRAKDVLWGLLARGFYVSPLWCVQYHRLLWLARQERTPGTTQTLVQAVLECRDPPSSMGPVGGALQAARQLGWQRCEGWW